MKETFQDFEIKLCPISEKGIPAKEFQDFIDGLRKSYKKALIAYEIGNIDDIKHDMEKDERELYIKFREGSIFIFLFVIGGLAGGFLWAIKLNDIAQKFKQDKGFDPNNIEELRDYFQLEEANDKFVRNILKLADDIKEPIIKGFKAIGKHVKTIEIKTKDEKQIYIDGESADKYSKLVPIKHATQLMAGKLRAIDLDKNFGRIQINGKRIKCFFEKPKITWFMDKLNKHIQFTVRKELISTSVLTGEKRKTSQYTIIEASLSELPFPEDE